MTTCLLDSCYQVVLIDRRGTAAARATRGRSYEPVASDVLAVMDALHLDAAALMDWSDGACIALILAMTAPKRVASVFYFARNMDPGGAKQPMDETPALAHCFQRRSEDYARLSATPDQFKEFGKAIGLMQRTQPNTSPQQL